MRVRRFLVLLALSSAAILPGSAQAQIDDRFGIGGTFELYHFSDAAAIGIRQILLVTTPVVARVPLTSRFALALSGAWARGSLERPDGSEATISGLTDTELRATYVLGNDRVTLSAVALLPTGHDQLDDEEALIAGVVAADVLPFRITNWGTGGGIGANIAVALPFGSSAAGIGAGYVVAREFEPLDNSSSLYQPGNQLHLTAALDHSLDGAGKLALRLSFLTFASDQADGRNLYQSGDRIQGTASWSFAAGSRSSGIVYGGILHRGEGDYEVSSQINPAQDLIFAGILGRMPFGRGVLQPGLDLRLSSGNDDAEKGYTAGAGLAGEFPLSGASLAPTLRLRYGSAEPRTGSKSTYVGTEVGLGIRFGGR